MLFQILATIGIVAAAKSSYSLTFTRDAPSGSSIVIPNQYMSLSIEVSSFPRLGGTPAAPVPLTMNAIKSLYDVSGSFPDVRVTGMDNNFVQYVATQSTPISVSTLDNHTSLLLGPEWFEYFQAYPVGTTFTVGLNLYATVSSIGLGMSTNALDMSRAVVSHLADNLTAMEFGNEPDQTPAYTGAQYTKDFINYAGQIQQEVLLPAGFKKPMFAFGTLAREFRDSFYPLELAAAGANSSAADVLVQSFSNHKYPYNNCGGSNVVTNSLLINHKQSIVDGLYNPVNAMQDSRAAGFNGMMLGEVNSITCSQYGVSNSFASALWLVDWAMYGASKNITRMYVHFGDFLDYAPWFIADANSAALGEATQTNPLYNSMLLVSEAFGNGTDTRVKIAVEDDTFEVYGVWSNTTLRSLVAINSAPFNSTTGPRTTTTLNLTTPWISSSVTTKLLTAPSIDALGNVTYGGYSYDTGSAVLVDKSGTQVLTTDSKGFLTVTLSSSESLLIRLTSAGNSVVQGAAISSSSTRLATSKTTSVRIATTTSAIKTTATVANAATTSTSSTASRSSAAALPTVAHSAAPSRITSSIVLTALFMAISTLIVPSLLLT